MVKIFGGVGMTSRNEEPEQLFPDLICWLFGSHGTPEVDQWLPRQIRQHKIDQEPIGPSGIGG
jgi:hypothetical protein